MLAGGVLALLITQYFGKGAGSDAFFTAYGFYVIAVAFAQTLRLTALPRLAGDVTGEEEHRTLAATFALAVLAAVPMIVLARPIGALIADGDPTGVAAQTLRLLWPALALHLVAGVLVPMLTLRAVYTQVGLALALASAAGVVTFVLLQPELGIDAVATGLTSGAALLVVSLAATLAGTGWRPSAKPFRHPVDVIRDGWKLVPASASFLIVNVGYLICLAVANHLRNGSATIYAYAFFASAFLVATTAIPSAIVRAPGMLDRTGGRGVTVTDVVSDFKVTSLLVVPAFGIAALLAEPLIDLGTGGFFNADDASRLVTVLFCLAPWVMASIAGVLVVLELLNRGRVKTLAAIAVGQAVTLVPLAIVGGEVAGLAGIAAAQSLAMVAGTGAQIRFAYRETSARPAGELLRQTVRASAVGAIAFVPLAVLAALLDGGVALDAVACAAAVALYAITVRRMFSREWDLLARVVRRTSADDN